MTTFSLITYEKHFFRYFSPSHLKFLVSFLLSEREIENGLNIQLWNVYSLYFYIFSTDGIIFNEKFVYNNWEMVMMMMMKGAEHVWDTIVDIVGGGV